MRRNQKKYLLILVLILGAFGDLVLMAEALRRHVPAWSVTVSVEPITIPVKSFSTEDFLAFIELSKKPEGLLLKPKMLDLCPLPEKNLEEISEKTTQHPIFEEQNLSARKKEVKEREVEKTISSLYGNPRIAIVIDDMGVNSPSSERAIKLPAAVTLSFLPYTSSVKEQSARAKKAGHKLLLHMPMEPIGNEYPGQGALFTKLSEEEIIARVEKQLDSFSGFDGANNHMGSKFTADPSGMETVIKVLKDRGVFFLDSRTGLKSVAEEMAKKHILLFAVRDIFLDDDVNLDSIRKQLLQTGIVAKHKGYAIAIGHPHQLTMQALEEWLPEAKKQGFELVPVSELVR